MPQFIGSSSAVELGVVLVHLVTGEDVLGRAWKDDAETRIDEPTLPQIASPDGRQFRVGLIPYRPYIDSSVPLVVRNEHVVAILPVNEDMAKLYVQFTSNITIAKPTDIKL